MMNRFCDIDYSFKQLPPVYGYQNEKLVSIDEALEPIQSQINQLCQYIETAKTYCHFPSEDGLSKDESAAIYIYTMEWGETSLYRVLNKVLQSENRQALKVWFPYLKLFDTALNKLPTVKENVWRGVALDISENFTQNQLVTWWTINSCSSSIDVIKRFLENENSSTLFFMETLNGKKVFGYTESKNEDEIIVRMGTQFRVKNNPLDQSINSHVVYLIEVDDENDEDTSGFINIPYNAQWEQNGVTVAGRNDRGDALNQLNCPLGLFVDDDQTVYVADYLNHRIVKWKSGAKSGKVVAGGNGKGNRIDQLNEPTDVIVDKETDSLIICDKGNRRVMRWSCRSGRTSGEIIIENIKCRGLAMDNRGFLYVTDSEKGEVRRYGRREAQGTVVAGGNGGGVRRFQLDKPTHVFVDRDQSVYVSDWGNNRVMKWVKDAKEEVVVAGGQGRGNGLAQLSGSQGVFVDQLGTVYVTDMFNHRVMRWCKEMTQSDVIVGGNNEGAHASQFNTPMDLSFDRYGNLYVADRNNHRVQRFSIKETTN